MPIDAAPDDAAATSVRSLPRGPHGLSRAEVVRSQRLRLMRAMAEATAERGYVETSVADVLRRAHVSRETFYQQFASKQECFAAAYEQAASDVLSLLGPASAGEGDSVARVERTIGAYLDALAAEPAFARLFMVEVYAAGDDVLARRAAVQQRFVDLVIDRLELRTPAERFAGEALVAAVITLVTTRLAARDIDGLRALRDPLVGLVRQLLERR